MRNADERHNIGTFGLNGLGWWLSHVAAITAVGYLGYALRKKVRE